jgi:hypothetical protein
MKKYVNNESNFLEDIFGHEERLYLKIENLNTKIIGSSTEYFINEYLLSKGYKITEYIKGYCIDLKDNRIFKIGKILKKFGHKKFLQLFEADVVRGQYSDCNTIVLSKKIEDIQNMSTNRRWTSCTNLDNDNHDQLIEFLKLGGVIIYGIDDNDKNIENPYFRLFYSLENTNSGIFGLLNYYKLKNIELTLNKIPNFNKYFKLNTINFDYIEDNDYRDFTDLLIYCGFISQHDGIIFAKEYLFDVKILSTLLEEEYTLYIMDKEIEKELFIELTKIFNFEKFEDRLNSYIKIISIYTNNDFKYIKELVFERLSYEFYAMVFNCSLREYYDPTYNKEKYLWLYDYEQWNLNAEK